MARIFAQYFSATLFDKDGEFENVSAALKEIKEWQVLNNDIDETLNDYCDSKIINKEHNENEIPSTSNVTI